jgi:hypothetical protein
MPDAELKLREVCFCFRGIMGEIHYCERHGGGVDNKPFNPAAAAAPHCPVDAFEPHPVVLWGRPGERPAP